ncbi:MAG: acyl carrier protein, partial [Dehalococcoidia bacterium]|nr:acyl carrier protein [Dehalococcoidia bacterium]
MASAVEEKIKEIITGIVHCDPKLLTPTTTWKDLKADSLDLVQVLVQLEETYGIEISDTDAEKLKTFGDLVAYIEHVVAARTKV